MKIKIKNKTKSVSSFWLGYINFWADKLMIILAFLWLGLMIAEFLGDLNPSLVALSYVIWGIFIVDFIIRFYFAPNGKIKFLRNSWIIIISLILPAFRILRVFKALGALRAISLVRILTSISRSMSALVAAMGKQGVGYVIVFTVIVLLTGAAGMYYFENPKQLTEQGYEQIAKQSGGLQNYGDALWWTAMLMTSVGVQYWPVTIAGRILCFLISIFSLGVFGYITAILASFFVGRNKDLKKSSDGEMTELRQEIKTLQRELKDKI